MSRQVSVEIHAVISITAEFGDDDRDLSAIRSDAMDEAQRDLSELFDVPEQGVGITSVATVTEVRAWEEEN